MERFEEALAPAGANTKAIAYVNQYVHHFLDFRINAKSKYRVREITRMTMMTSAPSQPAQQSASGELFRGFSSISNRVSTQFLNLQYLDHLTYSSLQIV